MKGRTNITGGGYEADSPIDILNLEWQENYIASNNELNKIIFAGDKFVAVGDSGLIAHSSNGKQWSVNTIESSRDYTDIIYEAGTYIIIGHDNSNGPASGYIGKSSNYVDWTFTKCNYGENPYTYLHRIIFDGSMYCIAGMYSNDRSSSCMFYSTDLLNFTYGADICTGRYNADKVSLTFCNGRYVYSVCGINTSNPSNFKSYVSTDNISWTESRRPTGYNELGNTRIMSCNDTFYLFGDTDAKNSNSKRIPFILTSKNAMTWTAYAPTYHDNEQFSSISAITIINNNYIILAKMSIGIVCTVTDDLGKLNVAQGSTVPFTMISTNTTPSSIAHNDKIIAVVGTNGCVLSADVSVKNNRMEIIPAVTKQSIELRSTVKVLEVKPVTKGIDNNIKPENIKSGITILGVTGTL